MSAGRDYTQGPHDFTAKSLTPHTPDPSERAGEGLTEAERLHLARCVYSLTGHLPPKGITDLSSVRNEVEHCVERLLADRMAARAGEGPSEVERWRETARGARREFLAAMADLDAAVARAEAAEAERDALADRMAARAGEVAEVLTALEQEARCISQRTPVEVVQAMLDDAESRADRIEPT